MKKPLKQPRIESSNLEIQRYLPSYAYEDAKKLVQNLSDLHFFCGVLASNKNQSSNLLFNSCTKNSNTFFFYDIILPERNIYYPSYFVHSFYAKIILGKKCYQEYIKNGALFGILHKNNFKIEKILFRFGGAFAAVFAQKTQ